jgi:FAD/FMN-containing dehydrogenase
MNQHLLAELKDKIDGEVVTSTDSAYSTLRNVLARQGNPALIVRCQNNADVALAIAFARANGLKLSVRSGGHAMSGVGTNDGGLVIDLSHLGSVNLIDAKHNLVRIGAGARWGDAAKTIASHGLAISSGDTNSVGVGGLTVGGGIGWMVRKYGLTIDSLESAEIVLASGRTLTVSETAHPELFWAIRGGGGNFGVVTSFVFRAQPVRDVWGGRILYGMADYEAVLKGWVRAMDSAPEELNSTLVIFSGFGPTVPPGLMVLVCYAGADEALAQAAIQPLRELGTIQHQDIEKKPYYKMLEDAVAPPGLRTVTQNGFAKTISPELLDALLKGYGKPGTPILQIRRLGGAINRIPANANAFAHRDAEAFILAASLVPADMPADQAEQIRQTSWQPLAPFATGAYINFLSDLGAESLAAAYPTDTYARLASIKATYDPENIFNQNGNILPTKAG